MSVGNLPTTGTNAATKGASFTPTVSTPSDGVTSVMSNSPSVCTVESSGIVAFVNVGSCSLTAKVAASTNYVAATGSAQTFIVLPTPLIVDTDVYSSPDDVGALATAFGLQMKGEANVIATVVNTRTDRTPAAMASWKCVAAVNQFFGSSNTLLGIDTSGTGTNDAGSQNDFIGACAAKALPATPKPAADSALSVYRQALASQPDHSVVISSIGYFENLAALLNSPNDRALVAKKVRMVVAMGGCYPLPTSCPADANPENNFIGNPGAAANVAANWPTNIVWSGWEVGTAVMTSVSSAGPASSPVRAAYETYFSTNDPLDHRYDSYDQTAVYHAIVPSDSALTEKGPGTNAVDPTTGVNSFTMDPNGKQYYLSLTDVSGLQTSLNTLMNMHP